MSTHDDTDKLLEGALPNDPAEDSEPVDVRSPSIESADSNSWSDPVPLGAVQNLPAFPVDVLPPWLRRWVLAVAEALQCPVDLPAMLGLAVISLTVSKKLVIKPKPDWDEPTNLYIVVALKPGELKTHAFSAAIRPIEKFEVLERKRLRPEIESAMALYEIASKRIENIKTAAAKKSSADPEEIRQEVEEALAARAAIKIPIAPRCLADDITSERLAELMREQGGRIAIFSDEGGPFEIMGGRYSEGTPNFEVYLKGYSGSILIVDRIGRNGGAIRKPAITMGLTVQPSVIESLGQKRGFRGRGLLGRFFYVIPDSIVGSRNPNPKSVPAAIRETYDAYVTGLLQIPGEFDDDGELISQPLWFDEDAYATFVQFKGAIEPALGPGGELATIADWGTKLGGCVVRLAGLLYVADHADRPADLLDGSIDAPTVRRAIRLGGYAVPHAQAAFGMMDIDPTGAAAKHVLAWITRNEKTTFDRRHAYLGCRPHFKTPEEIDPALQLLIEHGYIRQQPEPPRSGAGRRPSPTFDVNPLAQNAHNAQNVAPRFPLPNSEHSENDLGDARRELAPGAATDFEHPPVRNPHDRSYPHPNSRPDREHAIAVGDADPIPPSDVSSND